MEVDLQNIEKLKKISAFIRVYLHSSAVSIYVAYAGII